MTRRELFGVAAALVVLAMACEKSDAPADPVWGKQACASCSMLIGDRRYAAQAVQGGERKYFDDIGCMVVWMESQKTKPEHAWVRSADGWADATTARYAGDAKTPMDFGLEARASGGASWDEARALVLAKGKAR